MPPTPIRNAVFPVAGLGSRFLPATKVVPKELLPVVDRPLIQYVVDESRGAGAGIVERLGSLWLSRRHLKNLSIRWS